MWLKQAVLLLLTVAEAAMAGYSQEISLNSTGDPSHKERVNTSARSLKFLCRIPTESSRYRVFFYFRDSNTTNRSIMRCSTMISEITTNISTTSPKTNQRNQTEPNTKCYNKTLEIHNITRDNNGFYSCEIQTEIPMLTTNKSLEVQVVIDVSEGSSVESTTLSRTTETQVTPEGDPLPKINLPPWFWLLLGFSLLAVIILMVLCVIIRRACLKNRAEPIYMNTNLQRSPRSAPQRDQLKLPEAYQNLRTPSPTRSNKIRKDRTRP